MAHHRSIPIVQRGRSSGSYTREDLRAHSRTRAPAGPFDPVMIKFMENAALRAILPYLDVGETAVGTEVSVRHLAATPVGRKILAKAEVTAVDGARISFRCARRTSSTKSGMVCTSDALWTVPAWRATSLRWKRETPRQGMDASLAILGAVSTFQRSI